MGRLWHTVLLISLLVYVANCDNAVAGEDEISSATDTAPKANTADNEIPLPKRLSSDEGVTSSPDSASSTSVSENQKSPNATAISSRSVSNPNGIIDLTMPMFTVPYDSFQIQVFNTTSDGSTLFYAPAATLLPDGASIGVNDETNSNCLFVSFKLWDKPYIAAVRDYVNKYVPPAAKSFRVFPLPFKWMLVGYSTNGFSRAIKNTAWQPIANMPPTVSVCIHCPTVAACNETLTALQTDSTKFASRLFLSFATSAPNARSSPVCVDAERLPKNEIVSALSERFAKGEKYIFMQPSDYANFTKTVVAAAVERALTENEFVDDEEMGRLAREMSNVFAYNTTTTENFTPEMWAATYWKSERPDMKASRLESVLGQNRAWVSQKMYADYGYTINTKLSSAFNQAYDELIQSGEEMYWDDKVLLRPMPMYRVSLDALRPNALICNGEAIITSSSADYTVVANVGGALSDDGPQATTAKPEIKTFTVSKAGTRWQARNADNLWAFNNENIVATLLDANDEPFDQFAVTTSNFTGEFYLTLPRTSGYSIVFEVNQYYPITLRNFSGSFSSTGEFLHMEPLLFIPTYRGTGAGRTGGTVHLVKGNQNETKAGIQVELRAGRYNLTGPVAATAYTAENGTWLAELPSGHYTVTISAPDTDYAAPPLSVVVVPKADKWRDCVMTQPMDNDEIRIILRATGYDAYDVKLLVSGPLENSKERAVVQANANISADGWMVYDNVDTMFGSVLIKKQLPGVYRIQVNENNYRQYKADADWNLANSQSTVQIYRGNHLWAQYYVPVSNGNKWVVAEFNDFRLNVINEVKLDI
ncbi:uncharacterized protein LOC129582584 isoform X2 [Paramacrobiotus metropolitanus]|uniref:uncharacterized protein LOC129582584 isoform X2 n=1 Tax=Paramacrobiotus metropolitanus TaxID=2943436 RepID=UPI00244586BB|nr:uncharacterized protein LOC129582584 isoform X2 [Paramacrobiotus metropolitanus]